MLKKKKAEKSDVTTKTELTNIPSNIVPSIEQTNISNLEPKNVEEDRIKVLEAKIESLKVNQEIMAEKIDRIEKMVKEIYDMAKS